MSYRLVLLEYIYRYFNTPRLSFISKYHHHPRGNVVCPNKQNDPLESFHEGHLLESETYIGMHNPIQLLSLICFIFLDFEYPYYHVFLAGSRCFM